MRDSSDVRVVARTIAESARISSAFFTDSSVARLGSLNGTASASRSCPDFRNFPAASWCVLMVTSQRNPDGQDRLDVTRIAAVARAPSLSQVGTSPHRTCGLTAVISPPADRVVHLARGRLENLRVLGAPRGVARFLRAAGASSASDGPPGRCRRQHAVDHLDDGQLHPVP
jgi:hypothetical protein